MNLLIITAALVWNNLCFQAKYTSRIAYEIQKLYFLLCI